jgi:drug/metabolite transporter (DMT)-like permease
MFADLIRHMSEWCRDYLMNISLALVATLMFVYGDAINKAIQKRVKIKNFVLRVLLFVLICGFGLGAFIVFSARLISQMLGGLENLWLFPIIVLLFFVVGVLAERKKHI